MNDLKICDAPIEINPCLFTWNIFQRYADLINKRPHYEVFKAIEGSSDKERIADFLAKVWECLVQHPPISLHDDIDWVIKLKYLSWVCAFDKDLGYVESLWMSINKELKGKEALQNCQQAESAFYKNMTRRNEALKTIMNELLLPCIQISKDILKYFDDDTTKTNRPEQS
jgi:hypothetical protein